MAARVGTHAGSRSRSPATVGRPGPRGVAHGRPGAPGRGLPPPRFLFRGHAAFPASPQRPAAGECSPRPQPPPPGRAGEPAPRGRGVAFAGAARTLLCGGPPRPAPTPAVRAGGGPLGCVLRARRGRDLARDLLAAAPPAGSGREDLGSERAPERARRRGAPQRRAPGCWEPGWEGPGPR